MLFSYLEGGDLTLNALTNLYRFVRQFLHYWHDYPYQLAFMNARPELLKQARDSGELEEWYGSRLRFAWKCARVWWGHRDKYSRICTGDCERCNAKHC